MIKAVENHDTNEESEYSSVEQEKQHQEDQMAINDATIPSTDNNYFYSSLNYWMTATFLLS